METPERRRAILARLRADLWQAPRAHGEVQRERTVGQLELFYDLAVVVLVAQAAHHLAADITGRGFERFVGSFLIVWMAWFNGTLLHDLHGREDARGRNIFLAQILLLVPLGATMPGEGGVHGPMFAETAALLFAVLSFFWWLVSRADTDERLARATLRYVASTLVFACALAISSAYDDQARLGIWIAASALYVAAMMVLFAKLPGRFDQVLTVTDALVERFGLLVIIVLGETIAGIVTGLSPDPSRAERLVVAGVAVLVSFGSWWTYFDFVGHREPRGTASATSAWFFAHLPLTGAIACIGAAMPAVVESAGGRLPSAVAWLLAGAAAVVLLVTAGLMTVVEDWDAEPRLIRPVALVAVLLSPVPLIATWLTPRPLGMCLLLVAAFATPWVVAVVRRAALEVEAS